MSARSPYCDAHPNGTHLRCMDCAERRLAARPPVVRAARVRPVTPPAEELLAFAAQWPDRTVRQRVNGRLLSHDDAVWEKWRLTPLQHNVRMVQALRHRTARCVVAEPAFAKRALGWLANRIEARAERRLS